jgi:hypothetical protein
MLLKVGVVLVVVAFLLSAGVAGAVLLRAGQSESASQEPAAAQSAPQQQKKGNRSAPTPPPGAPERRVAYGVLCGSPPAIARTAREAYPINSCLLLSSPTGLFHHSGPPLNRTTAIGKEGPGVNDRIGPAQTSNNEAHHSSKRAGASLRREAPDPIVIRVLRTLITSTHVPLGLNSHPYLIVG